MEWDRARQQFEARLARREALAKNHQDGQPPMRKTLCLSQKE
jgi:hypothetical protein